MYFIYFLVGSPILSCISRPQGGRKWLNQVSALCSILKSRWGSSFLAPPLTPLMHGYNTHMCIVFIMKFCICKLLLYGGGGYCDYGTNQHCHSSVLALARSMITTCASNHCYQMESLITRDIIPSLSIESFCSNPFSQSSCTAFHFLTFHQVAILYTLNLLI